MTAAFILSELQSVGTPEKAVHLSRFSRLVQVNMARAISFSGWLSRKPAA